MGHLDTNPDDVFRHDVIDELFSAIEPEVNELQGHLNMVTDQMVVVIMFREDLNKLLQMAESSRMPFMFSTPNRRKHGLQADE